MADRRIYAKLRFEWNVPDSVNRSEEVKLLKHDISWLLPDKWAELTIDRVAEGEVDDA